MRVTPARRVGIAAVLTGLALGVTAAVSTGAAQAAAPLKLDASCLNGACEIVATAPAAPAAPAAAPAAAVSQSTGTTSSSGGAGGSSSGGSSGGSADVPTGPSLDGYGGAFCGNGAGSTCADILGGGSGLADPTAFLNGSGKALCSLGQTGACPTPAAPAAPAAPGAPAAPPPPPPPSPAQVAQIAISQMQLQPVGIGIVPKDEPGKIGVVGMPTWMWVKDAGEATTGPMTRSATAGPVTVTAVAVLDRVVWNMGDGSSVTCHGAGVPYSAGWGAEDSPTCGHRYQHTSEDQPGMAYTVTATSYWTINWFGGGGAGVIPQQVAASTRIQVGEFQTIVTHSSN